ncbi:MAG: NifU family protein [candidate division WOR-3 bacterium]
MMLPETKEKVSRILAEQVRPGLQADGGDAELVEVTDDGVVRLRLTGACAGCPFAAMTLAIGVEATLKKNVPEVVRVEPVP